jgi:glycogen debranching enzyme
MRITINSDTTFIMSDDLGNLHDGTELGLYHEDTRFLSVYELTLDGHTPLSLAARPTAPYAAAHFLTNPILPAVPRGQLSLIRRRQVGDGMREEIEIVNYGETVATFTVELRLDADFCHLFEGKHEVQISPDSQKAGLSDGRLRRESLSDGREHRFAYAHGARVRTLVVRLSEVPQVVGGRYCFALHLAPRQPWRLALDFLTLMCEAPAASEGVSSGSAPSVRVERGTSLHARHSRYRESMVARAPLLETDSLTLRRAYARSVQDFAALQTAAADSETDESIDEAADEFIIAAGIPWFMTLFGRDSLITAYEALPYFPDAAKGTLRALARLQGSQVDPLRVEEPGKILHEYRSPTFTGTQHSAALFPYYGTVDATPLFLKLLADVYQVTGDLALMRDLRGNALRALDWMARYGDRDGDGYIEYIREAEAGLYNQGWKDSGDAVRFRDGRLAEPPIALCEVQGYAYAAKVGVAEVFAALGEAELAATLRTEAAALKERFNRDFWMSERGCYAFALDGAKRQVDALTSNAGQVLWTGIAEPERARAVARLLVAPELYSGWGVRTMASCEGGYNPISYHNGSVWPHDTSLIVAGLARYGCAAEAQRIAGGLLAALDYYPDSRLPELFAGYSAAEAPFPVEYPTACRPQAWAAGSVFLLLSVMTGLDVSAGAGAAFLPKGLGAIRLHGVWRDGVRTTVEAYGGGETAAAVAVLVGVEREDHPHA